MMSEKVEFKNRLLKGLVKSYIEAVSICGDHHYLIPSNFSIIATNHLKILDVSIKSIALTNQSESKYNIVFSHKNDQSVLYEFIFDAKTELRNSMIDDILG